MSLKEARRLPDGTLVERSGFSYRAFVVKTFYVPIGIGIMLLGGIFGGLGVVLVYRGATGASTIKLFGQSVETASVGVASLFIGAVTVVVVIRYLLRSVNDLNKLDDRDPLYFYRNPLAMVDNAGRVRPGGEKLTAVGDVDQNDKIKGEHDS